MATFTYTPAGTWKAEIRIKQSTRIHRITRTLAAPASNSGFIVR